MKNLSQKAKSRKVNFDDSSTMMPIMSLLIILIPLLISNIAFFHFRTIEVNTPSISSEPFEPDVPIAQKSKERRVILQLSINVQRSLFELIDEDTGDVIATLLIKPKARDLASLETKLLNVKRTYPKLDTVLVSVEENVRYKNLVSVLDKCGFANTEVKEGEKKETPLKLVLIPQGGV